MKKLVTALIIVLPLIFVVAIFAITSVVRLSTSIPVTSLVIGWRGDDGEGTFHYDLATFDPNDESTIYEDQLQISVLPDVAANKNYVLDKVEDAQTHEPTDIITREEDEDGRYFFVPHDIGNAIVTYKSEDGGYTDSVQFVVTSSDVLSFTPTLADSEGNEVALSPGSLPDYDYVVAQPIKGGKYQFSTVNYPNIVASTVSYTTDSPRVALDEGSGEFETRFSGDSCVTITVGKATATVLLSVQKSGEVSVNGSDISLESHLTAPADSTTFTLWVETDSDVAISDISVSEADGGAPRVKVIAVEGVAHAYKIEVTRLSTDEDNVDYTLTISGKSYPFHVNFAPYQFKISSPAAKVTDKDGDECFLLLQGDRRKFTISVEPRNDNITYTWEIIGSGSNSIAGIFDSNNNSCTVIARESAGKVKLVAHWQEAVSDKHGYYECNILVSAPYSSLSFNENSKTYGLGSFAIASHRYNQSNNTLTVRDYTFGLNALVKNGSGTQKATDISDLTIQLSDDTLAEIRKEQLANGKLVIHATGTGLLQITVSWEYGEQYGVSPAKFTLQVVDGVEIGEVVKGVDPLSGMPTETPTLSNDVARDQLTRAMEQNRAVVLGQDVYLGEDLYDRNADGTRKKRKYKDDSEMLARQQKYVHELPTTWDWTYYKNQDQGRPNVKYILEITADVYGNGHQINAEYITNTLDDNDKTTYSVFKGPLDFVSAVDLASVKGQDNIVFLVRKPNIRIDNTVLSGCNSNSMLDNGEYNLSLLNYMGTTLEVMNDLTLVNSRVMNGRTVMRIYGKDGIDPLDKSTPVDPAAEKINVTIDGCVLSYAREFILKVGTNRFVSGTEDNPEPSLFDGSGHEYTAYNSDACDNYINDEYFMSHYLLTEVTLKDSTLSTSGLFSIGMESHFAGTYLVGKGPLNWHDLAGTSYPALLRLVGNVVLEDWKDLALVDSSSLIEVSANAGDMANLLTLDINKMLQYVGEYGGDDRYKNIIAPDNGVNYVHGGIALYGGGKNYHMVDRSLHTFYPLNSYAINISVLAKVPSSVDNGVPRKQGENFPYAAGTQDFRFLMYDNTSAYKHNAAA